MTKETLISHARSAGFYPVADNTSTSIQFACPGCSSKMMVFQRSRFEKTRILACICGYRHRVNEDDYERLTGHCFVCGKRNCCASDHRFHGMIRAGMGL